jgi:hypothetical protein
MALILASPSEKINQGTVFSKTKEAFSASEAQNVVHFQEQWSLLAWVAFSAMIFVLLFSAFFSTKTLH